HEQKWVVTLPLILLAIPSVLIGYFAMEPMLYSNFFGDAIYVNKGLHPVMHELALHFHGAWAMATHSFTTAPLILAALGVGFAWFFYMKRPDIPAGLQTRFSGIYKVLENKYGFDSFNEKYVAGGARYVGNKLWQIGDVKWIDGFMVNGTATLIGRI